MPKHAVVDHDEWLTKRKELLAREKELTRLRDELSEARRALPWKLVDKDYVFDTSTGPRTLAALFDGRSQLLTYHFMFGPDWEAGCPSCSFWADNFERNIVHLAQRDITLLCVSRAPLAKLEAYRKRMNWTFDWVSSAGNDFNQDFHVSFDPEERGRGTVYYNYGTTHFPSDEAPGISAFILDDDGKVYHTYSAYARGLDTLNSAYHLMDLAPKGRNEGGLDFPMAWVRRHDEYPKEKS